MSSLHRRVSLGTAQFGLDYGATNRTGRVTPAEVHRILTCAADNGVGWLDTARQYGTAEDVLGEALATLFGGNSPFRITTKTARLSDAASDADMKQRVVAGVDESLRALRLDHINVLLFHDANDLLGRRRESAYAAAAELQRSGKVGRIGVSVYNPAQAKAVLQRTPLEVLQIPLSILDQRFEPYLAELSDRGIDLQARSVFLQGLLVTNDQQPFERFSKVRAMRRELEARVPAESRASRALGYVGGLAGVKQVVLGVTSRSELEELFAALSDPTDYSSTDWGPFALADDLVLNPSTWPAADGFAPALKSERIGLRRLAPADVTAAYVDWMNNPEVVRYLETRFHEQTTETVAAFVQSAAASDNAFLFAIVRLKDGRHVGNIKLGPINRSHGQADVSLLIGERSAWGQGFGTEAVRLITQLAFKVLGLEKLSAGVYAQNEGSTQCFLRNGWHEEGTLRSHRNSDDGRVDVRLFGLTWHDFWDGHL